MTFSMVNLCCVAALVSLDFVAQADQESAELSRNTLVWVAPDQPPRGWLGVRIDEIPAALASHLRLDQQGVMIVNVEIDGPADQAGLQRYDVVVEIEGKPTPPDFAAFGTDVGAVGPHGHLKLKIIRAGAAQHVVAKLTAWPSEPEMTWRYEDEPEQLFSSDTAVTGRVLRRKPDGTITIEALDPADAPFGLDALRPHSQRSTTQVWVEDGRIRRRSVVVEGDVLYEFEQTGDTTIRVRKVSPDGSAATRTYPNIANLKASDPQVYNLYQTAQADDVAPAAKADPGAQAVGELDYRFEDGEGGTVVVTIRKGDIELQKTFRSAAEMQAQKPKLYERYRRLEPSE
jgi:hypothetical protein